MILGITPARGGSKGVPLFYAIGIVNDHPLCIEKLRPLVDRLEIIPQDATGIAIAFQR